MKITGTSSFIIVQINDKTVKIEGEMLVDGFLAYSNTIKKWESPSPYNDLIIDDKTKVEIIKAVINRTSNSKFKIVFD
ncbi:Imm74 family immunity protein [Fictibacillus halophilus]|uniref:Imm74 family immunity protein n=1 Tax=Fictibacillus halophilus TaxID=1610490 RepID=UPI001CF9B2AB|nr:Imm74 family immunity protein [Fictibacillus halophilus]